MTLCRTATPTMVYRFAASRSCLFAVCDASVGSAVSNFADAAAMRDACTLRFHRSGIVDAEGFAASRTAAREILWDLFPSAPPGTLSPVISRDQFARYDLNGTFSHEERVGAAIVGPLDMIVGVDIVSIERIKEIIKRRPSFSRRWVPRADPCDPVDIALHWGVRECLVKLRGKNEAVDMSSVTVQSPENPLCEYPQSLSVHVGCNHILAAAAEFVAMRIATRPQSLVIAATHPRVR